LLFFFSSRRRHTSFSRDWSSDVCSSDLLFSSKYRIGRRPTCSWIWTRISAIKRCAAVLSRTVTAYPVAPCTRTAAPTTATSGAKIGRAPCRQRVATTVDTEQQKKQEENK